MYTHKHTCNTFSGHTHTHKHTQTHTITQSHTQKHTHTYTRTRTRTHAHAHTLTYRTIEDALTQTCTQRQQEGFFFQKKKLKGTPFSLKRKIEKRQQTKYLGAARGVFFCPFFPFHPQCFFGSVGEDVQFFFVVCFLLVDKKCVGYIPSSIKLSINGYFFLKKGKKLCHFSSTCIHPFLNHQVS